MSARGVDVVLRRLFVVEACKSGWFWLPTAFLLFSTRFDGETAIVLAGVYYLAEVVLEVPSGWMSDRFGRRLTLVAAMALQLVGGVAIALGADLATCVLGQIALAGSSSFVSGTDTALLYDWLKRSDRLAELQRFEARIGMVAYGMGSVATVTGGFASAWWLPAGYLGTALAGLVGLFAALGLRDAREPDEVAGRARGEWGRLVGQLRRPRLAWLAAFSVAMQVFNHVPLEFHQPYIALLGLDFVGNATPTETTGLVLGTMMALASVASRMSTAVAERFGAYGTLLFCFAAQIAIVWGMACVLHPAVLLAIACRGVPHGIAGPVRNARLHAELTGPLRATWFSAQTLAGSLLLSVTLVAASRWMGGPLDELRAEGLSAILLTYAIAAAVVLAALAVPIALWRRRGAAQD